MNIEQSEIDKAMQDFAIFDAENGERTIFQNVAHWHLSKQAEREAENAAKVKALEAQCAQLRIALLAHSKWHEVNDEHGGWPDSELAETTTKALTLAAGQSVLDELERMRKALEEIDKHGHLMPHSCMCGHYLKQALKGASNE